MLTQSLLLAVFIGALFLVVVSALRDTYVDALSPDPVSATDAIQYLSWFIPAMALQFPMVVMGAALRGTGNFKPGMIVQTATVIINIVLAPALMFGWLDRTADGCRRRRASRRSSPSSSARSGSPSTSSRRRRI